jgi:hypothetical protein
MTLYFMYSNSVFIFFLISLYFSNSCCREEKRRDLRKWN